MKKTIRLTLLTLFAHTHFAQAQGPGVSGPDTHGWKTSTDEKILMREDLKAIFGTCLGNELLEIAQALSKHSDLALRGNGNNNSPPITVYTPTDLPATSSSVTVNVEFSNVALKPLSTDDQVYGQTNARVFESQNETQFSIAFQISNSHGYFRYLNMFALSAPQLRYTEAALPGSFDEYGNVIGSKIVVTRTEWLTTNNGTPNDLSRSLPFFNSQTKAPVVGLSFNQPRYVQCVNLKLGSYAPSRYKSRFTHPASDRRKRPLRSKL